MLQTIATRSQIKAPPARNRKVRSKNASAPPQILSGENHPIYGSVPIGKGDCTLESEPLQMLNHWHREATWLINEFIRTHTSQEIDEFVQSAYYDEVYNKTTWDILNAAFKAKPSGRQDLAALMQIVTRHVVDCQEIEHVLDLERLQHIERLTVQFAQPEIATKTPREHHRGSKLTRGIAKKGRR